MNLKKSSFPKTFSYKLLVLLFFTLFCNSDFKIKVLISDIPLHLSESWNITGINGLQLIYPKNKATKTINKPIKVTVTNHEIFLDNRKFEKDIVQIKSVNGPVFIEEKPFQGSLYILKTDESFMLLNKVDIDDYTCSVLHTESWPGWSLEVNKTLAIACRSYATAKVLE